jgi:putative transposase
MTRPLRYSEPECLYHITARGNRKQDIVRDDCDRLKLVELLARTVLDRKWILNAWVLMTNHLHLVVTAPLANLSEGMRDFLGAYGRYFNQRHDLVGHLFQHRFGAKVVERDGHLLELVRYVPLNPVRCGLVNSPADWQWSSYRATAGLDPAPDWLEVDWTLRQFHPTDRRLAQIWFREFVSQARGVEYDPHEETKHGWIIGSKDFCDKIQRWIDERSPGKDHSLRYRQVVVYDFKALVEVVKETLRIDEVELRRSTHGPARKIVADLGHDECGLPFSTIARRIGITGAAACKLRSRSRELSIRDSEYAELLAITRQTLRAQGTTFGEKLIFQT